MGNTKPHKDLPTLLQAFSLLASSEPDLRCFWLAPDPRVHRQKHGESSTRDTSASPVHRWVAEDTELRPSTREPLPSSFLSLRRVWFTTVGSYVAFGAPVVCAEAFATRKQ